MGEERAMSFAHEAAVSEPSGMLISCDASMGGRNAASRHRMSVMVDRAGFSLLLLSLVALLLRPMDLIPSLEGTALYEALIAACLLVSLPRVASQVAWRRLTVNPVVALALLMAPAVFASHVWAGSLWSARHDAVDAIKSGLLFLLIVGHSDSPAKLRAVLSTVAASVLAVTVVAVLNYYGVIHIATIQTVTQRAGEGVLFERLCGTGIFNDPNDFSLILVLCLVVCAAVSTWRELGPRRYLVLIPLLMFGHALILTQSRGGIVAAGAGLVAFLGARYRWRNVVPVLALLGLVVMSPLLGRQTQWNVSNPDDTFQARLELWSSSLDVFRSSPLFGIGRGTLVDRIGQVAHNSYLHAFAELGLFGGLAFLGAFAVCLKGVWACRGPDADLARLRPFVLAAVAGYAAGLMSLTRCYTVSTQLLLALGAAYLTLIVRTGGIGVPRLNARTARFVALTGVAFLAGTYITVRFMLSRGV